MMKTDYNEDKTMYTTDDKKKKAWVWICPVCGEVNLWEWDPEDIPQVNDDLNLVCEHCGKSTPMICEIRPLRKPRSLPVQGKDILGDVEKLQKEVAGIRGSLPMIEEDVENIENAVRQADRRIAALEKEVVQRITAEMVQLSSGKDAPDTISFLISRNAALDCSPDGLIRLVFPEDTAIPLDDLRTAIALLLAHDPAGSIDVVYEGGIVVRLWPHQGCAGGERQ